MAVRLLERRGVIAALAVAPLASLLSAAPARALVAKEVRFSELLAGSTRVALVIPRERTSRWELIPNLGKRIVSYTRVEVSELMAGKPSEHDVWVRSMGGVVGKLGQRSEGEPDLVIGKPCLLFLRELDEGVHVVAYRAQGEYRVTEARGERRLQPSRSAPHASKRPSGDAKLAREVLSGARLDAARDAIRKHYSVSQRR